MYKLITSGFSHRLFRNTAWLVFLQLFNYAAPLMVLPYISRLLTVNEFGAVMVSISTVAVAFVITDYGFGLSATYKISKNSNNKEYISNTISKIYTAKIPLVIIASLTLLGVSYLPQYRTYQLVFLAGLGAIISQAYHTAWLFQGLENMKAYTVYMALIKLMYIVSVLISMQYLAYPETVLCCWSLANIFGAYMCIRIIKKMGYSVCLVDRKTAWLELKTSAEYFFSRIAVVFFTSASSIVIGAVNLHQAALYAVAEQAYKGGQAITNSVGQALFPYMSKEKNWTVFFRVIFFTTGIIFATSMTISLYSEEILVYFFGSNYKDSSYVLGIMMFTLCINFLSVVFGYPAFAALGNTKPANNSVVYGSICFLLLLFILYTLGTINGSTVAICILITESVILAYRLFFFKHLRSKSKSTYQ